jgi:hypothetical protein
VQAVEVSLADVTLNGNTANQPIVAHADGGGVLHADMNNNTGVGASNTGIRLILDELSSMTVLGSPAGADPKAILVAHGNKGGISVCGFVTVSPTPIPTP